MSRHEPPSRGPRRRARDAGWKANDSGRQDRTRIAQAAAQLIVQHGIDDWALAKRKAARQLMLDEGAAHPSNEEVEAALADYQTLFGGQAQRASLRAQRQCALDWMLRLDRFAPLLVGGVAAGWAGEHGAVRIELAADDAKPVAMLLAGQGVAYRTGGHADGSATLLLVDDPRFAVRLEVVSPDVRRHRPRQDGAVRLDAAGVRAALAAPP